jgi:2-polyprenyl-3-methyl-5-hydroxy-6-metoxy-1,4-benzoquinol methylase
MPNGSISDRSDNWKKGCPLCGDTRLKGQKPFEKKSEYSISRCCRCGAEFVLPLPSLDFIRQFYQDYHQTIMSEEYFDKLVMLCVAQAKRINAVCEKFFFPNATKTSFLDIGGGSGALCVAMNGVGFEATLQDISEICGFWLQRKYPRIRRKISTIEALCRDGKRYDVINLSQVLEHVLDPRGYLESLKQILSPGGLLLIDCPNNDAIIWRFKNIVRPIFNRMNFYNSLQPPQHLWGFNKESWRYLFQACGYEALIINDYGLGDANFQPHSELWYPSLRDCLRRVRSEGFRDVYILGKIILAAFDRIFFSPLLEKGGGIAAVIRKSMT